MKTFVLNVGNTSVTAGVFSGDKRLAHFRVPLESTLSEEKFSRMVLRRVRGSIDRIAFASVVPRVTPQVSRWLRRSFRVGPLLLTADAPHGLTLRYRRPRELGTDRLAAVLGAATLFPEQNAIVVDCGTATTVTALRSDATLLGGAIFPGLALWPAMLATRTAQLPEAKLQLPRLALGRSTDEALRSGIYHGHTGAVRELVQRIREEAFGRARVRVIGTGGNAAAGVNEGLFDAIVPDLVLVGLNEFAARATADRL